MKFLKDYQNISQRKRRIFEEMGESEGRGNDFDGGDGSYQGTELQSEEQIRLYGPGENGLLELFRS